MQRDHKVCRTMRAWFGDGCGSTVCSATTRGTSSASIEIEDQLSVGSAEDAELVLEQDRVEAIGDDSSFSVRSHVVMPDDCHDVRPELLRVCHDCRDTGTFEASSALERRDDISRKRCDAADPGRVGTNH